MPFLTDDVSVIIDRSGVYVLTAPLVYRGARDRFEVPAGFHTDLASVPRILTWLVPVAGVHDRAAILHDALCVALEHGDSRISSPDVDGLFRRVLRELGVPPLRR